MMMIGFFILNISDRRWWRNLRDFQSTKTREWILFLIWGLWVKYIECFYFPLNCSTFFSVEKEEEPCDAVTRERWRNKRIGGLRIGMFPANIYFFTVTNIWLTAATFLMTASNMSSFTTVRAFSYISSNFWTRNKRFLFFNFNSFLTEAFII